MADVSRIIAPKSDQLNADDLVTGDRTIHIRAVEVRNAGSEQPVSIYFDGDDNKPWKPCKIMTRLLAGMWGPETAQWVGKSAQLYRDPDVMWGGAKVGGIRVRKVSHIEAPMQVALSESQKRRKIATIGVLTAEVREMPRTTRETPQEWATRHLAEIDATATPEALQALIAKSARGLDKLRGIEGMADTAADIAAAYEQRAGALAGEGRALADMGEGWSE